MTAVYRTFFGLSREPFGFDLTLKEILKTPALSAVQDRFDYTIRLGGIALITGDIGSGKTTVCRTLLNKMNTRTKTALITNTHMSGKDLLCAILEDLEVEYVPGSKARLLSQLNSFLIEQLRNDCNVV